MSFNAFLDTDTIQKLSHQAVTVAAYAAIQYNHAISYANGNQICVDIADTGEPVLLTVFRDTNVGDLQEIWSIVFNEDGDKVQDCLVFGESVDAESALEFIHDHYRYVQLKQAS